MCETPAIRVGDLRKAAVDAAVPGVPVVEDHDPLQPAAPLPDQQSSGLEPDALARCRPAGRKGTSVRRLEGVVSQTPQDRPIEISECRGLDPIGEHAHEQPSRKMGGSDLAQLVSPLEAKLIQVEDRKARDRGVDRLAF